MRNDPALLIKFEEYDVLATRTCISECIQSFRDKGQGIRICCGEIHISQGITCHAGSHIITDTSEISHPAKNPAL